jgi:WD40 repeat protein
MPDVFVSYSRRDAAFVHELVEGLERRGKSVWIDTDGIGGGEVFPATIRSAIEQSDAFVFIITPESVESRYCETEIEYALELHKRVIPVLREIVGDEQLPEAIRVRHWVQYTQGVDIEAAAQRLVAALDAEIEHTRAHTRWLVKALEWSTGRDDKSVLLRGSELATAEAWLAGVAEHLEPKPTPLQREYVYASRSAATRRQRTSVVASLLAIAVALGLAGFAFISRNQAQSEALTSDAERLSTLALTEPSLDRSFLLAVAGLKLRDRPETRGNLLTVLQKTPALVHLTRVSGNDVPALAVGPDGGLLASGDTAGVVRFTDLRTWQTDGATVRVEGAVSMDAMRFSPDGRTLAVGTDTAGTTSSLYLVDVSSRRARRVGSWPSVPAVAGPVRFTRMAFSPDGTRIAVAVASATTRSPVPVSQRLLLLAVPSARVVWERKHPMRPGQNEAYVAFTRQGAIVTSAQQGETVVWDARTGKIERRFPLGGPFAVSPGGNRIAVAQNNANPFDPRASLAVLDLRTGTRRSLEALPNSGWIVTLQFTKDGANVVGRSSGDSAVRLWNVASGSIVQTFTGESSGLDMAVVPDGREVLSATEDGIVAAWDLSGTRRLGRSFRWRPPDVGCAVTPCFDVSAQGALMAESLAHGKVGLVDLRRQRLLGTLPARNGSDSDALAFFPDGKTLATGGRNGHVTLWDVRTRSVVRTLRLPDRVWWVAVSPDGKLLAIQSQAEGSPSSRVEVRDLGSGRVLYRHVIQNGKGGLSFSPDGSELAGLGCCAPDSTIEVWAARSGAKLFTPHVDGHATSIAFSPDGGVFAAGTEDGKVVLWDAHDGSPLGSPLQVATGAIDPVSFSPNGRLFAASSADQTATLWDIQVRKRVANPFPVEIGSIPVARFTPGGDLVIDNLTDTAQWPTDVQSWVSYACQVAGRDLTRAEWHDFLPNRAYRHVCPR